MNLDILEVLQGSLNNKGGVEKFNSLSLPLGEGNLDAEPSAIGKLRVVRLLERCAKWSKERVPFFLIEVK